MKYEGLDELAPEVRECALRMLQNLPEQARPPKFKSGSTIADVERYLWDIEAQARDVFRAGVGEKPLMIMFIGEIGNDAFERLSDAIHDDKASDSIHLFLTSPGGKIAQGDLIYNLLRTQRRPVHTYAIGPVDSAAMYLYLAGDTRRCDLASSFLFHPPTQTARGYVKYDVALAEEVAQSLRGDIRRLGELTSARTGIPAATVMDWQGGETRLYPDKAVELGIATDQPESIALAMCRSWNRVVWLGGDSSLATAPMEAAALVYHRPRWRFALAIVAATAVAKVHTLVGRKPWQFDKSWKLAGVVWSLAKWALIVGSLGAAAYFAMQWYDYEQVKEGETTPDYACNDDKQDCQAAWQLHRHFGGELGKAPGKALSFTSDGFEIVGVNSAMGGKNGHNIERYIVNVILDDGTRVPVFQPVIDLGPLKAFVYGADWVGTDLSLSLGAMLPGVSEPEMNTVEPGEGPAGDLGRLYEADGKFLISPPRPTALPEPAK